PTRPLPGAPGEDRRGRGLPRAAAQDRGRLEAPGRTLPPDAATPRQAGAAAGGGPDLPAQGPPEGGPALVPGGAAGRPQPPADAPSPGRPLREPGRPRPGRAPP